MPGLHYGTYEQNKPLMHFVYFVHDCVWKFNHRILARENRVLEFDDKVILLASERCGLVGVKPIKQTLDGVIVIVLDTHLLYILLVIHGRGFCSKGRIRTSMAFITVSM